MDLEFTADQEELRTSVRAVLARECPPSFVREIVEKGASADDLWAAMVDLDWPALTIDPEYGGLGLGFVELAVVVEELGRAIAPGPFLPTLSQFVPAIREAGSAEQQRRFLADVVAGRITGTLAVAEESGSWAGEDVTLVARSQGDGWILHGSKHYVADGATANELVVAARLDGTDGPDGLALFIVPREAVAASSLQTLDASRQYASVHLDGVTVGPDRTLGEPGRCAPVLARVVEEASTALALEMVGTCQSIFDIALEHAKTREQFGSPIGSFQAMKHKFADMFVALESARAVCYFASATLAEDDERRSLAVSMAKAAAGDCQRLLTQEGIQTLGGIGYTWEHDMHLYVKRAKSGDAVFGTARQHRARVATLAGL
ncbi:MAG TPA: acyl-CoA dehydrogenase family protein [Acidimicrobiales bacterium]|nr:acyl-CoA dehydrogenase family protein [Acidimicrobiales bacterium]